MGFKFERMKNENRSQKTVGIFASRWDDVSHHRTQYKDDRLLVGGNGLPLDFACDRQTVAQKKIVLPFLEGWVLSCREHLRHAPVRCFSAAMIFLFPLKN
jgi:hypothetical protein